MNIFLVRHGQSEANLDKLVHLKKADHAIELSPRGRAQAKEVSAFFQAFFKPHMEMLNKGSLRVWSSPYARALDTANIIFDGFTEMKPPMRCLHDRAVYQNINLVEQQFGLFDGISHEGMLSEIQKRYPNEYAHYKKQEDFEGKFWARMPLGESRFDVALRVHQCFGTFHRDKKHGIKNLVIVSHGVTIRAFIMQWFHLSVEWFEAEPNPKNCSVRHIVGNKDMGYIFESGE